MEDISTPATDPTTVAATYATAWQTHDWDTMSSILADDVTFRGPLGVADSAVECLAGLQHMAKTLDHIDVRIRLSEGNDVITWFDLHSTIAPPTPTVNWTHVEDGKITAIRVTFDPRPTLEGLAQQG